MITSEFLQQEIADSKKAQNTSRFIRQFIFRIVDEGLRGVYGDNYSTRCFQASIVVQTLLAEFGIRSHVISGAVCLSRASRVTPFDLGWAGFWGDDHHVWIMTEFLEVVDLTISQLHLHPASSCDTDEPIPPMWWHPADIWPPIIKYLPKGIAKEAFPSDEEEKLERLKLRVADKKLDLMRLFAPSDSLFGPILFGPDHAQEMADAGHPWLVKSLEIQKRDLPLPSWIENRERELMAQFQVG